MLDWIEMEILPRQTENISYEMLSFFSHWTIGSVAQCDKALARNCEIVSLMLAWVWRCCALGKGTSRKWLQSCGRDALYQHYWIIQSGSSSYTNNCIGFPQPQDKM